MDYTITPETAAALACIKKCNAFLQSLRAEICISKDKEDAAIENEEFGKILIASQPLMDALRHLAMERIENNLQFDDGKL